VYKAVRRLSGSWLCIGRLQDGHEQWTAPTEQEAVSSLIAFAKAMNNSVITVADVEMYTEKKVSKVFIEWERM